MEKLIYIAPSMEVSDMEIETEVLAGSGDGSQQIRGNNAGDSNGEASSSENPLAKRMHKLSF